MSELPIERDEASGPWFDSAAGGRLLLRRCADCGHWIAPYTRMGTAFGRCPACTSDHLEWAEAAGTATLVTWTVGHDRSGVAHHPVGTVELSEGPWLTARLDADPAVLAAGVRLKVGWVRPGGGEPVPVFGPDPGP